MWYPAGGVIEPTRIMLAVAGVQYEDFRYPIDPAANFIRKQMMLVCLNLVAYSDSNHLTRSSTSLHTVPPALCAHVQTYARPEFEAAQAAGTLAINMNRAPMLEVIAVYMLCVAHEAGSNVF